MLAVLPEYRNAGLGRRLKLAQRDDALERGIDRMEWTFDPLEIKNAHLNIARLGAIARRYMRNIYGPSTSPLQGGLPTDRPGCGVVAEVGEGAAGIGRRDDGAGDCGRRGCRADRRAVHRSRVETDPQRRTLAESLQTRNRLILESAFARGLAITGYERCANGDGSSCWDRGRALGQGTGNSQQGTGNRTTQRQGDNNADYRRSSSTRDQHASRLSIRD